MLHPDPHGERLGLKEHPLAMEHRIDVVRRVPRSQHHRTGLYPLIAAHHTGHGTPAQQQLRHPAPEPHLAAAGGDRPTDGGHDTGQPVGADMRMGLVEYRLVGAVEDERTQGLVVVAALLAPGEELAVGEGPRAPLAESIVGIGIEPAVAVQLRHVATTGRHLPSPFEDHGTIPRLDQTQRTEKPRGTAAHNHHLLAARHVRIIETDFRGGSVAVNIEFERQVHTYRLPARIHRTFQDTHQRHIGRRYPDPPGGDRGVDGLIGGLLGRKGERYRIGHRKFF